MDNMLTTDDFKTALARDPNEDDGALMAHFCQHTLPYITPTSVEYSPAKTWVKARQDKLTTAELSIVVRHYPSYVVN